MRVRSGGGQGRGLVPERGSIYQDGRKGVKLSDTPKGGATAKGGDPRGGRVSPRGPAAGAGAGVHAKRLARATFLTSARRPAQFPVDSGAEVAFAGRSNAGKSSAINALTGRRALARVSKTPGHTRLINFFEVDPDRRLVDLPGYGYAKVSKAEMRAWANLVEHYLHSRVSLSGIVLITDARRGLGAADRLLLDAAAEGETPVHLVLTKADKLNRRESRAALAQAIAGAETRCAAGVQLFSSTRRIGVDALAERICEWLAA